MRQHTLKAEVTYEGVGVHTGKPCRVTLRPAKENSGRVFRTPEGVEIPARVDFVTKCDRSTVLGREGSAVHTPEHLLSALAACLVDNVEIELTGPEIPILDGSSARFYRGIQAVGLRELPADAVVLKPQKPYVVKGEDGQLVLLLPSDKTVWEYSLYYDHPMLGYQHCVFESESGDYGTEIAPARTFALWEEVQPLLERGLAQGGSLDNALVVYRDRFSSPLTVGNEPVRHKCLDLIGDFALLDARIQARVLAVRAGHRLHVEAVKAFWEETKVLERS